MRNHSHDINLRKTVTGILRDCVHLMARSSQTNVMTVCDEFVEAHKRIDGPDVTGIEFEPPTKDTYTRLKVNGERIIRWLDELKQNNKLLNFLPSMLAGMPENIALKAANEILAPAGMGAHFLKTESDRIEFSVTVMQKMIVEDAQAHSAYGDLLDGASRAELLKAQCEFQEAIAEKQKGLEQIEQRLAVVDE